MAEVLRACGKCTLCCKLMPVLLDDGTDKPEGQWCKHCEKGCAGGLSRMALPMARW
jgi:hypothetical protein